MVPAESHTVELAFIYQLEHDRDVVEYHAQPSPIKLAYTAASGRPTAVIHTPDFLVLKANEVGWVECKTEDELQKLAITQPGRYRPASEGTWRCPPGEAAASKLGFSYRIWSSGEIDQTLLRNIRFLGDYLAPDYPDLPPSLRKKIVRAVMNAPGTAAKRLVEDGEGWTYEDVFALIGKNALYVNLREALFTQLDRVRIFPDEQTALAMRFARLNQFQHDEPAPSPVPGPSNAPGAATALVAHPAADLLLHKAKAVELEIANRRFRILQGTGGDPTPAVSVTTLRRWKRRYRLAEEQHGCGYVGLLRRYSHCGNRTPRLPAELYGIADGIIQEHFMTRKGRTRLAVYGVLQVECEKRGLMVPSYRWLTTRIRSQEDGRTAEIRDGQYLPERSEADLVRRGTEVHGDRPWEVIHIDHTLCDLELVDQDNGLNLGRPWLTVAFDAHSRRVLAFYLSFDHPSYRSCLMALRECVRRHGRLPACCVVDGGPDFRHHYFDTFCARYGIVLKYRPPARPYFGSVIERLFGTLGTQFFTNLAGNTHVYSAASKVIGSDRPHKDAVWTLERLHELLTEYCFRLYDNRLHPAHSMTPALAYERGIELAGVRTSRCVAYDDNLIAMTLPTTRMGRARIQRGMGVKIRHIYYWSDEMRAPQWVGQSVPVRYDPWNLAVAYAYLKDHWAKCVSAYAQAFQGRSEKELMLATARLRKSKDSTLQQQAVTAKRLAEFFMSAEAEEKLRKRKLKDLATQRANAPRAHKAGSEIAFEI